MYKTTLLIMAVSGLATACASYDPPDYLQNAVKPGDHLVVTRPVDQGPYNGAVYFREGEPKHWFGGTAWFTECRAILERDAKDQKLSEGEYTVVDVTSHEYANSIDSLIVSTRIDLKTLSGAPLEAVDCERMVDLGDTMRGPDAITVANFHDAVGDFIQFRSEL